MSDIQTLIPPELQASVVLPALNEEEAIVNIIPRLKQILGRLVDGSFEVLVIDGGSVDKTRSVARDCGAVVYRQERPGYAAAVATGILAAKGEWIFTLDADGSHPLALVPLMWESRSGIDMVIASRRCPQGSDSRGFGRKALSEAANYIFERSFPFGITDFTGGFRLLRRQAVNRLKLLARDFDIHPEIAILLLHSGGSFREIPYCYRDRTTGQSKARILRYACSYLLTLARLRKLAKQSSPANANRNLGSIL